MFSGGGAQILLVGFADEMRPTTAMELAHRTCSGRAGEVASEHPHMQISELAINDFIPAPYLLKQSRFL